MCDLTASPCALWASCSAPPAADRDEHTEAEDSRARRRRAACVAAATAGAGVVVVAARACIAIGGTGATVGHTRVGRQRRLDVARDARDRHLVDNALEVAAERARRRIAD